MAWSNLQSCGKVWVCPVCAAKIRGKRASEIAIAGVQQLKRAGGLLTMAHTLPHDVWVPLEDTWKVLSKSYTSMCGGKAAMRDRERFGIVGHIKAQEVTVGKNGWHPHSHSLWFTDRQLTKQEIRELNESLFRRFGRKVERMGFRAPLSTYNRMEVVRSVGELAVYVAKAANEIARFDRKQVQSGRTPFQVLEDFGRTGDCEDLERWREWEKGSRGRASIYWSRGLKPRFDIDEASDDELVSEEVEGQEDDTFTFTSEQWERVLKIPTAQALLMELMESGGSEAVLYALDVLACEAESVGML